MTAGLVLLALLAMAALVTGCSRSWSNFSQYPGFNDYYIKNPRSTQAATAAEQALLQRFRPRLFLDQDAEGPISFYADYIAQGSLSAADGTLLSRQVDSPLLNQYKASPEVVFRHQPESRPVNPQAFGRVDYDQHPSLGRLSFLTYHFVFRSSGIVAGLPGWQSLLLPLAGDLDDWHQLDHYTAATLVLDPQSQPLALMLQQHNNLRSYVLGVDLPTPDNFSVRLVAAKRSNELYPWHPGIKEHPVVRFLNPDTLPYLVTGNPKPWVAGYDLTEAVREAKYELAFIPPDDAFYSFAGFLGERRRLPGRDGPPGADYNSRPAFKRPLVQLVAFNWQEEDQQQMHALLQFFQNTDLEQPPFKRLLQLFERKLAAKVDAESASNP